MLQRRHATGAAPTRDARAAALRLACALVGGLAAVVSAAGVPARAAQLHLLAPEEFALDRLVMLCSELVVAGAFLGAAALIAARAGGRTAGLLLAIALASLGAVEAGMSDALLDPEVSAHWRLALWPVLLLRWVSLIAAMGLLYTFPSGRFAPRWTRPLMLAWAALVTAWLILPDLPLNMIYGPTWRRTPAASLVVSFAWLGSGVLAQAQRFRFAASAPERQQIKWWALGCSAAILGTLWYSGLWVYNDLFPHRLSNLVYWTMRPVGQALGMVLLPVCLAIGMLRHSLLDVDLVISRALVYGALSACVAALYLLLAGGLGLLAAERGPLGSTLVVCALALLVSPLRERLQRAVSRLLYGERDEPYRVLSRLNRRLEQTLSADAALPTIVETVGRALRLPYVAVELESPGGAPRVVDFPAGGRPPEPHGPTVALPLAYQGESVGVLRLALRAGERELRDADRRLLEDLALQAGIVAHDAQVTADLQRSRAHLVAAREEERRRIRRDLHDGLGPTLASLSFRIAAARNLVRRDPAQAEALLEQASDQFEGTIGEVRRLVYALRPPALDELGLVDALRQWVDSQPAGPLRITLDVPQPPPALPAAVEVAAYRVALEALTNVQRHARARSCRLELRVGGGRLELSVRDDGVGIDPSRPAGVGLAAMRERADELGGGCEVRPAPGGGTLVRLWLPL